MQSCTFVQMNEYEDKIWLNPGNDQEIKNNLPHLYNKQDCWQEPANDGLSLVVRAVILRKDVLVKVHNKKKLKKEPKRLTSIITIMNYQKGIQSDAILYTYATPWVPKLQFTTLPRYTSQTLEYDWSIGITSHAAIALANVRKRKLQKFSEINYFGS